MSLLEKTWVVENPDAALLQKLSLDLKLSDLLARILVNRGVGTPELAQEFLSPKLSTLTDPFDLPNLKEATQKVLAAKAKNEKITVYGDYDVDGVTATVILLQALRSLGIQADYYIPRRYGEGYGMNLAAVQEIAKSGSRLIITVDCGISNHKEIAAARLAGIEVIVTDHHQLPQILPDTLLINPKLLPGNHPTRDLSGAGVAFKFAWGLLRSAGVKESATLIELLDLAALGTVADIVPLNRENRILAVQGLAVLNQQKRLGLKYLLQAAGIKSAITVQEVNFGLSPRLNSAGRLEHASTAVDLLLSSDHVQASKLAADLNRINTQRQEIGKKILESAEAQIKADPETDNKIVVLSAEGWHPGVIGIAASKLVDRYSKPTVLIGIDGATGRGSARSLEGVNVFALLNECRDLFLDFGGHEGAAGFAIETKNIPALKEKLIHLAKTTLKSEDLVPKLFIDSEIQVAQMNLEFTRQIETLGPFGAGNDEPVFVVRGVQFTDKRTVGSSNNHLKIKFSDGKLVQDGIGFNLGHLARNLSFALKYDIVFNLNVNVWNGNESVQIGILDIKEAA